MKRYSLYRSANGNYILVYNGTPKLVTTNHFSFTNLKAAITAPKSLLASESYLESCTHEADFDNLSDLPDTHPELYL